MLLGSIAAVAIAWMSAQISFNGQLSAIFLPSTGWHTTEPLKWRAHRQRPLHLDVVLIRQRKMQRTFVEGTEGPGCNRLGLPCRCCVVACINWRTAVLTPRYGRQLELGPSMIALQAWAPAVSALAQSKEIGHLRWLKSSLMDWFCNDIGAFVIR